VLHCFVYTCSEPRRVAQHLRPGSNFFPDLVPVSCAQSRNSHGIISFAGPHPLTPVVSYRCKIVGGERVYPTVRPQVLTLTLRSHKSSRCSTYGSPHKCCKQRTYGLTKSFRCNTYKKQGGSLPVMVNQVLEARHPASSHALCLRVSVAAPSSIFRTLFQVPYPVNPLLATLAKTAGVCTNNSQLGTNLSPHGSLFTDHGSLSTSFFPSSPLVDRQAKAGDNFRTTLLAGVAPTSEEGE
jgi:hypothetical protein